jgi:hypothetical protein
MPVAANPTPTSRLRLEKQTVDSNENAWGTRLNQSLDLVDLAFSTEEVTVSSDVTLTSTNYADNQSRALCLILSGDGGYAVTTPAVDKPYLVVNNCTSDVTMKPSGGTAATIRAGTIVWYYNNAAGDTGYVVDTTLDKIKAPVASVAMGSQKLTGMAAGTSATDGATLSNRLDQFATPTASVAMGSQKITGLADGTIGSQDAAPVAQVESLIASATVNLPATTSQIGSLHLDSEVPGWRRVNLADGTNDVTGVLAVANGGTGGTLPIANGGTGATTAATARVSILPDVTSNALKVLRVNAGETDYELITPSALPANIVQTVKTDTFSTSSTSLTDITGLSVSITPSSSANRVCVSGFVTVGAPNTGAEIFITLVRGSTAVGVGASASNRLQVTSGLHQGDPDGIGGIPFEFIDSPATTSATTYKIQMATTSGTAYVNRSSTDTDSATYPRAVSVITVQEIGPT